MSRLGGGRTIGHIAPFPLEWSTLDIEVDVYMLIMPHPGALRWYRDIVSNVAAESRLV